MTSLITHNFLGFQTSKVRRALEKIDLLFLAIEAIDINASQSFDFASRKLDLLTVFPNSIEIWKSRCHNPIRRSARNSSISTESFNALLVLLSSMTGQLYPQIRVLLSTRGYDPMNDIKFEQFRTRFSELISERMNLRRGAVRKYLNKAETSKTFHRKLLMILALSSGPGGLYRLSSSIFDPLNAML
ncbi:MULTISPECIES: DUF3038 domain-containing protein [unclassified Prochlorococcus]|uniref:DUF3038 domain-containing protein n=1 Tax=unclassified Prochlorococcus TaxID=2627481 RepID=UPI0005339847|nr:MULTISPECIES: DUF3038 domain-containing protein [unclassified Prochlorococcus]KGG15227.1 hypothetical protein EV06_1096 [Prochlorococcus sp. MIT 0602]KGG17502.1 hypothetical protein EV07_0942 [Prochlorococcus sp. MIT 0603]